MEERARKTATDASCLDISYAHEISVVRWPCGDCFDNMEWCEGECERLAKVRISVLCPLHYSWKETTASGY